MEPRTEQRTEQRTGQRMEPGGTQRACSPILFEKKSAIQRFGWGMLCLLLSAVLSACPSEQENTPGDDNVLDTDSQIILVNPANFEEFNRHANTEEGSSKHYQLTDNIHLPSGTENNWTPIGTITNPFTGIFDGNGHTISGLNINSSGNFQGLFGYIGSGAEIKNIGLVDSSVTGDNFVGGLVGWNNGGTLQGVYATGSVQGNNTVGGLVGWNGSGTVQNCHVTGTVQGGNAVGGIVGGNFEGVVQNCYVTDNVQGKDGVGGIAGSNFQHSRVLNSHVTGNVQGTNGVGGIVGNNAQESTVQDCHTTGSVRGHDTVGGVVGSNFESTVQNCYARGNVTSTGRNVGGVVGLNNGKNSTLKTCYATGNIEGHEHVGGVVGMNVVATTQDCYALGHVTGENDYVGGVTGTNNGLLKNCYATGSVRGGNHVGGIAGHNRQHSDSDGVARIEHCAALNLSIQGTSYVGLAMGRRSGKDSISAIYSLCSPFERLPWFILPCVGFNGINGDYIWDHLDELSKRLPALSTSPWSSQPNRLPGLFGQTIEMPAHLARCQFCDEYAPLLDAEGNVVLDANGHIVWGACIKYVWGPCWYKP